MIKKQMLLGQLPKDQLLVRMPFLPFLMSENWWGGGGSRLGHTLTIYGGLLWRVGSTPTTDPWVALWP